MSEKRFHQFGLWVIDDPNLKINTVADLFDTKIMSIEEVVDLLNEQQDIITELEKSNDEYRIATIKDIELMEQAEKKIGEQQATISQLQDLCGKSDYENAKLRIENKRLCDEIKLLKPTNIEQYEQIQKLRKELGDCEKFRYQVFKRMNEEYKKECSIR